MEEPEPMITLLALALYGVSLFLLLGLVGMNRRIEDAPPQDAEAALGGIVERALRARSHD
jgi:hypothetical protein